MNVSHVALVTTSYPRFPGDPAGHFVETEVRERAAAGDRVTVLAPGPLPPSPHDRIRHLALHGGEAFGSPGALERLREMPTRLASVAAFVLHARRALARLDAVDEVIAHWLVPAGFPIATTRAGSKLEVVVHGSDVALVERLPKAPRLRLVEALVDRGARFRFVSRDLRDRLARATTPRVLERSRVAPSPITVEGAPTRNEARARLAVPEDERLAVVVGRLVERKRPQVAVSWGLEKAHRVVVVGDGPLRRVLRAPRVELVGALPRAETLTWMAAADWLVNASQHEGAPTVIREARRLGVAVLTARCGDVVDWAAADPGITIAPE